MCTDITSLKRFHDIFASDQQDVMHARPPSGYVKRSLVIRQFSDPVPVGIIDDMSIAVTRDMPSVMPACKRNTDAVAAVTLSLAPSGAYGASVCVGSKDPVSDIMPVLLCKPVCVFAYGIYDLCIGSFCTNVS